MTLSGHPERAARCVSVGPRQRPAVTKRGAPPTMARHVGCRAGRVAAACRHSVISTSHRAPPLRAQRGFLIAAGLALAFGLAFGGIEGLVTAVAGVGITRWLGPRWTIAAALVALSIATVALFVEAPLVDLYDMFAAGRPITAAAARCSGILAMTAVLEFARRARARSESSSVETGTRVGSAWRVWWVIGGFGAFALVAVFTNSHDRYITDLLIGDNHFSLFFDPGKLFARHLSLWDSIHGLGRTRNNFWPVPTGALSLVRGIGVDAITAQRLWHAGILTAAGTGAACLIRQFRSGLGPLHVITGLLYMFAPASAVTLHSSYFLLSYALAPWFAITFLKGVRSNEPWRWAAVFALLFFIPGNPNFASLIDALIPILLIAVYLVHVDRSRHWREITAWLARAGLLAVLISAAALVTTQFESDVIAGNVNGTELPAHVAQNSSWFETMRGLGWWLLYFHSDKGVELRQFGPYFTSAPIIVASVALPLLALLAIGWTRARERLLFGILMLVGAGIVVGGFP